MPLKPMGGHRIAKTIALVLDAVEVGMLGLTLLLALGVVLEPPSPTDNDWADFGRALGAIMATIDAVMLSWGIPFLVNSARVRSNETEPNLMALALKAAVWNPISALAGMVAAKGLASAAYRYGTWLAMTLSTVPLLAIATDGRPADALAHTAPVAMAAALACAIAERLNLKPDKEQTMISKSYKDCHWTPVLVHGIPCKYAEERVNTETIPKKYRVYAVRHDDSDWSEPVEVTRYVLVNFFGTLLTEYELPLDEDGELWLDEGDWEEAAAV